MPTPPPPPPSATETEEPPSLRTLPSMGTGSFDDGSSSGGGGGHQQQQQLQQRAPLSLDHLDSTGFGADDSGSGSGGGTGGQQPPQEGEQSRAQGQGQGQPPSPRWLESNLYCWGRSQDGQAGPSTHEIDGTRVVPVPTKLHFPAPAASIAGGGSSIRIVAVSCGSRHTLALDEQCVPYSWGWGLCGQLGQGDFPAAQPRPRVIAALAPGDPAGLTKGLGVKAVSAGGIHSAAVDMQGFVYTWGESSYGQLGLGPGVVPRNSVPLPTRVMLLKDDGTPLEPLRATQVSCGGMHSGAVTADGRLYTWGRGDNGQLGVGRLSGAESGQGGVYGGCLGLSAPALVDPGCFESPVKQLSCGGFHTAVVTARGKVYTWGREEHGMLGHDVSPDKFTDAQDRPKEVEAASAIGGSGRGGGGGGFWEGGFGARGAAAAPTKADKGGGGSGGGGGGKALEGSGSGGPGMGPAVSVSAGGWHTTVVTEAGELFTCGRGEYGRLGLGDQRSHLTMVAVDGMHREQVIQASAGGTHTMVLTRTGHLYTYGRGDFGRLGHTSSSSAAASQQLDPEAVNAHSFRPKLVGSLMMTGARARLISAGGAHAAAVVEPLTGEEKGREEEEGLKAMYGASPTLTPVITRVKSTSLEAFPLPPS